MIRYTNRLVAVCAAFLCVLALVAVPLSAAAQKAPQDVENYFKGKTITLIIPLRTGGGVDLMARYFAAELGKFLPGNPRIVARNVTPRIAGWNFVAKAPPDGLTFGISSSVVYQEQADPSAQFKVADFKYIGATNTLEGAWFVRGDLPYDDILDASGGKTPIRMVTMPEPTKLTGFDFAPVLLAEAFDLPLRLIPISSTGTGNQYPMLERGEIDGINRGIVYYHLPNRRPGWIKNGVVKPFAFLGLPGSTMWPSRESEAKVPNVTDLIKDPELKQAWDAIVVPNLDIWLPFYLPPKTPDNIVEAYRSAFDAAMADAEFRKRYEEMDGVEARPVKGADVQQRVSKYATLFSEFEPRYATLVTKLFEKYTQRPNR